MVGSGLVAARTGAESGDAPSRSSQCFTGSISKVKKAIWNLREEMPFLRHIESVDDCGVAYTVTQIGVGIKTRIKFEPCLILFNQE